MNWMEAFVNRKKFGTQWKWQGNLRRTDGKELWYKAKTIARWDQARPWHLIIIEFKLPEVDFQYPTLYAIERTQQELKEFIDEHDGFSYEVGFAV